MQKTISIFFILLGLFLAGFMIYGGIQKFQKPIPTPLEVVEKAQKFSSPEQENTLQKVLYINGMKQTGYFWQFLGICELLFGFLLLFNRTRFVGALMLLPITLHIFLFHIFLEIDDIQELVITAALLIANIGLVLKERSKWKYLL